MRWYWPTEIDIVCPRCSGTATLDLAVFTFDHWEGTAPDVSGDRGRHLWNNVVVTELYPTIIPWRAPKGSQGLTRDGVGAARCSACGLQARHELNWPGDAAWKWEVRGSTLWAWSRAHAAAIRDYVAQAHREPSAFGEWQAALAHLPTEFLESGARDDVVRKIDRDLRRI